MTDLNQDTWRAQAGFTPEIDRVNAVLFDTMKSETEKTEAIRTWLEKYQPCLFGRIAAKRGLLTICVIDEAMLVGADDEVIRQKIHECRVRWSGDTFKGLKSGFVVAFISATLSKALPDVSLMALAQRCCSLYLQHDIEPDEIYTTQAFLQIPGNSEHTRMWRAGVNYFSAQGDGRWWRDHRFPGGLAFSVNSVGQMVKASKLADLMQDFNQVLGVTGDELINTNVDSLPKALEMAMRTIAMAAETPSGKATELLMVAPEDRLPTCPIQLPPNLVGKNYCEYVGYYNTDVTIPSIYFRPDG